MNDSTNTDNPGGLGRKHIKSFASGIAQMFATSAQHYAWLAHRHGTAEVTVNLLLLEIAPAEFDTERNRTLAGMCQRTLHRNMQRLAPPGAVVSATISATFGIDDYSKDGTTASVGKSLFIVILTDDRGKKWRVDHAEPSVLVQA